MVPWLSADDPFPPADRALKDPDGLLCAGADLSVPRLLDAYRRGIFPWFSGEEPILWWSPDPRMVLYVDELKVSGSLAKNRRNKGYALRVDTAFDRVLDACAAPRRTLRDAAREEQAGTWLGGGMRAAYLALHAAGHAHSFETWHDDVLCGGLYGVAIGRMFYGESMFSRATDASKVALVGLVEQLRARKFPMIDCQMRTPLLASVGAREIPRQEFLRGIAALVNYSEPKECWQMTSEANVQA